MAEDKPAMIEDEYEVIDAEGSEKAAKRAKLGELERDQTDSDSA